VGLSAPGRYQNPGCRVRYDFKQGRGHAAAERWLKKSM
jgi:hypothetical protein